MRQACLVALLVVATPLAAAGPFAVPAPALASRGPASTRAHARSATSMCDVRCNLTARCREISRQNGAEDVDLLQASARWLGSAGCDDEAYSAD